MKISMGQELALQQLETIEDADGDALRIIRKVPPNENQQKYIIEVSLNCEFHWAKKSRDGIPIRQRERFILSIPQSFPFEYPTVVTSHTRFEEFPHVQWKRYLCLYQAPSTEWNPADGMFGFIERLNEWLGQGVINQLDPYGAPLHPPVTYLDSSSETTIIPKANTPRIEAGPWYGLVSFNKVNDKCVEITDWRQIDLDSNKGFVGPAILLDRPLSFEFPDMVKDLLEQIDVPWSTILLLFQCAVCQLSDNEPMFIIIGTPMRGISGAQERLQHLSAWCLEPIIVKALKLSLNRFSENIERMEIGKEAEEIVREWASTAKVRWCSVREDRPEIVSRRDYDSSSIWFKDKTVAIWGCGALGSHIAEYLVRAGVKKLILRDKGKVVPGLLCRQAFTKADLGYYKIERLADRLKAINPDLSTETYIENLIREPLGKEDWDNNIDLIIETTASNNIQQCLELRRWQTRRLQNGRVPAIASMIISHNARKGLAVLSKQQYSGGPQDLYRKAKIEACKNEGFEHWINDFWPLDNRKLFQPEPGCSDPTFVGSQIDVVVLSGTMLNLLAKDLSELDDDRASAHFVTNSLSLSPETRKLYGHYEWEKDEAIIENQNGYEVRLSNDTMKDLFRIVKQGERTAGMSAETGGIIFGEHNDACRVIWVNGVSGPPSDSEGSTNHFICGVEGVKEDATYRRLRSRDSIKYLGIWHKHPSPPATPSNIDIESIRSLAIEHEPQIKNFLMAIVVRVGEKLEINTYFFKRSDYRLRRSRTNARTIVNEKKERHGRPIGLALSGGGSRAIAFHLGCMRVLHEKGLLNKVQVISGVSGGSVIAAMYAYSLGSFKDFEAGVIRLLRHGLVRDIAKELLLTYRTPSYALSFLLSVPTAITVDSMKVILKVARKLFFSNKAISWIENIRPPIRRWKSRTDAFERVLKKLLFRDGLLTDKRRDDIHIVINACDLPTGTAFRFGSRESGCYRVGCVADKRIKIAKAVAASAAFPVLLPAMESKFIFTDREGYQETKLRFLTDGGVFDNLGISCLEPGRSQDYSYNVFLPDYIFCCSAGEGVFNDYIVPRWWVTRMMGSFDSIYRKFQDRGYKDLHQLRGSGKIKGFILPYLGQIDERLPSIPDGFISREKVYRYPTDFSSMRQEDIEMISKRGEQLTEILLSYYCPELLPGT